MPHTDAESISIIIPISGLEKALLYLLRDIDNNKVSAQTIVVTAPGAEVPELPDNVELIQSDKASRAVQLNLGAQKASGEYLWFLHADSRLMLDGFEKLRSATRVAPEALHYFDLVFADDGPALMQLNQFGAWIRSRILGIPFGDQGLCISKKLFEELGGYPEDDQPGEDHRFVWKAKKAKMPVLPVGSAIITSARKYQKQGWARTTLRHLYWTLRHIFGGIFEPRSHEGHDGIHEGSEQEMKPDN